MRLFHSLNFNRGDHLEYITFIFINTLHTLINFFSYLFITYCGLLTSKFYNNY